ncbi:sodium-dependent multivitamin transporter-like isoform X2 [Dermacentor albipictus]|uniref:sodium-dependent multivitamin transporter-like isoform X2 n=1 Tax=Dermacentor albipictus TaxID=60249 RepID=UPI0038FCD024
MMDVLEYVLFGVLVLANFSLGLWFSLRKHGRYAGSTSAVVEVFLGSRTLMMLPLAVSTVASIISSTGLIALPAHYYVYGWLLIWWSTLPLLLFPLATHVFVPVLYGLGVTSMFEQSIGAISIFAASLAIKRVFHAPLLLCNIAIGLSGTIYTAMAGTRSIPGPGDRGAPGAASGSTPGHRSAPGPGSSFGPGTASESWRGAPASRAPASRAGPGGGGVSPLARR